MTSYLVTFERVGRNHDVAPVEVTAGNPDELAEAVWLHVRGMLASQDSSVVVNTAHRTGQILAGFHNAGTFTYLEERPMSNGLDRPEVVWRKSTLSDSSANCVEVAQGNGVIGVRDSKDPQGPVLCFTPAEWAAFLGGVKAGEFEA